VILELELVKLRTEISRLRNVELQNQDILNNLKQHADIQAALNGILQISLLPLPLTDQLQRILEQTLEIPWLELVKKGCIFLVEDGKHHLTMAVQVNLPDPLLTMCKRAQNRTLSSILERSNLPDPAGCSQPGFQGVRS